MSLGASSSPEQAVVASDSLGHSSESVSLPSSTSTPIVQRRDSSSIGSSSSVVPQPSFPPMITPVLDSKEAFLEFCAQYAPYMQYPALIDRELTATTEMLEALISRTDENGLLMDPLSTTTARRAETIIPQLKERASQLPFTFLTIDKLQELIDKLKANVQEAQRRVDEAEKANASALSVSKLFGVFSRKDKASSPSQPLGPLQVMDTKQEIANIRAEIKASSDTKRA